MTADIAMPVATIVSGATILAGLTGLNLVASYLI